MRSNQPRTLINMFYERKINIQNLMNLTPNGQKEVDEFELVAKAERLYRSIKVIGLNKTQVCYQDENGNMKTQYANELSEVKRAIAAFLMVIVYRWDDTNSGRLEEHYGLPTKMNYILGDVKVFKNNHAGLECICIRDFIDAYRK